MSGATKFGVPGAEHEGVDVCVCVLLEVGGNHAQ